MDLLESLKTNIGCSYISDLRVNPYFNTAAKHKLRHMNINNYSLKEIIDVIKYLYSNNFYNKKEELH